jgi:hypothetical protein
LMYFFLAKRMLLRLQRQQETHTSLTLADVFSGKILMAPLGRAVHFWWALLRRSRVAIILGTAFGSGFHRWCHGRKFSCVWMECQECASNMKASSVMWVGRTLRRECQIPLWDLRNVMTKNTSCEPSTVRPKRAPYGHFCVSDNWSVILYVFRSVAFKYDM